jgi:hypothetical protein
VYIFQLEHTKKLDLKTKNYRLSINFNFSIAHTNAGTNTWTTARNSAWTDTRTDARTSAWTDARTEARTDKWTDAQTLCKV